MSEILPDGFPNFSTIGQEASHLDDASHEIHRKLAEQDELVAPYKKSRTDEIPSHVKERIEQLTKEMHDIVFKSRKN
jgi:hypothetical protein